MTDPWNAPQYGQPIYGGDEQPGRVRPTGTAILLFFVTFGIYAFVYNYQVHDEMKRHSNRGLGGGVALLLSFVANVAMPFVTPAEVGNLYARKGVKPPVTGWTGLWVLLPGFGGYALLFLILIAGSATTATYGDASTNNDVGFASVGVGFLVYLASLIAGGIVWFVKTNGALNTYWETLQRGGFSAPTPTG